MNTDFTYNQPLRIVGDEKAFARALERFHAQRVDDVRLTGEKDPFPLKRRTIAKAQSVAGVGTFKGKRKATITFAPAQMPGWWIRRTDQPEQLDTAVDIANLWTSARNLVLRSGSPHNYLRMAEHIIALKLGMGVDNIVIETSTGDPPLFNASSLPLVKAIEHAGIVETQEDATFTYVKEPIGFAGTRGDFLLFLPPAPGSHVLRLDVAIDWRTVIGRQRIVFDVTPETFRRATLARTNATHRQYLLAKTIGKLFADTRNLGYDNDNILIHGRKYYGKPRFPLDGTDKFLEPVWHRAALDLLAALCLTGADRFIGTVVSYRAGHTQDCDAVRHLYRHNLLT
ncbi:MAG: UDP-3-O-acyl-N-acetylglucosamine deacetylase [Kiritimatiellae bacterium]|nr:UDP-3-O-acyl-N-acetylglucosamine deacetylase [Kiritimatiellia bacterium]